MTPNEAIKEAHVRLNRFNKLVSEFEALDFSDANEVVEFMHEISQPFMSDVDIEPECILFKLPGDDSGDGSGASYWFYYNGTRYFASPLMILTQALNKYLSKSINMPFIWVIYTIDNTDYVHVKCVVADGVFADCEYERVPATWIDGIFNSESNDIICWPLHY